MPGYLVHLSCAKLTLDILRNRGIGWTEEEENQFFVGSIFPDVCPKKASHFWDDEMFLRFDRSPNLEHFLSAYRENLTHPFVLGYSCHLYLDWLFMEDYWKKHFLFFDDTGRCVNGFDEVKKVKVLDTGEIFDREILFSKEYYYGDYDRLNAYLFERYGLGVPKAARPTFSIREARWEDAEKKLSDMILEIQRISEESQKKPPRESDGHGKLIIPPLKIFILSEFVFLMETTAKEVARLLV